MLGIDVKRGVASTLERVFNASGNHFDKLEVLWSGKTAGIIHRRNARAVNAKVLFPALDETCTVSKETFNNLIGYALHELGHAWFTDNEPWDVAREAHGAFVSNLINGLEDPRIERLVVESGRAPNSRTLFENLVNSILKRDGYVQPDDKKNIPFLLAVEGRRLNGYQIIEPSIVDASPWAADLRWALREAQRANDTKAIVKIAVELFERLKDKPQGEPQEEPQDEPQDGPDGQPEDKPDGQSEDGQGDGEGDGKGEPQDGPQGSDEGDGQGEGEDGPKGDSDGPTNGPADGPADGPASDPGNSGNPGDADGEGKGESSDKSSDTPQNGAGHSDESFEGGRDVEPSSFIEDEIGKHNANPISRYRPAVGKPYFETFTWR